MCINFVVAVSPTYASLSSRNSSQRGSIRPEYSTILGRYPPGVSNVVVISLGEKKEKRTFSFGPGVWYAFVDMRLLLRPQNSPQEVRSPGGYSSEVQ